MLYTCIIYAKNYKNVDLWSTNNLQKKIIFFYEVVDILKDYIKKNILQDCIEFKRISEDFVDFEEAVQQCEAADGRLSFADNIAQARKFWREFLIGSKSFEWFGVSGSAVSEWDDDNCDINVVSRRLKQIYVSSYNAHAEFNFDTHSIAIH